MIVKMSKYAFILYHKQQAEFLEALQNLGLVDITSLDWEPDMQERSMLIELEQHRNAQNYFKELAKQPDFVPGEAFSTGEEAFSEYRKAVAAIDDLKAKIEKTRKELEELSVWGEFSPEVLAKLADKGVRLRFFSTYESEFQAIADAAGDDFIIERIADKMGHTYFVAIACGQQQDVPFDAQEHRLSDTAASELQRAADNMELEVQHWNAVLARAYASREDIARMADRLSERIDLSRAHDSAQRVADDMLVVMEGWATEQTSDQVDALLEQFPEVVYIKERPVPEDNTPVVLKNNKFANPFEIIGSFYALPKYGSMDMTAFFGPFYMLFFGFCLGDAGYGSVLTLAYFFLRKKSEAMKQVANLTLLCGLSAVVFGFLAGSFFGIQLAGTHLFEGVRNMFFDTDLLFTLSIALGIVQIIFALVLNIINVSRQFGFKYSLGTLGWLMVILGGLAAFLLPSRGFDAIPMIAYWIFIAAGAFLMIFLHNPNKNPIVNLGTGLWNTYNNVTGLLGDVLSYIRLFALCLSGGTLALVFNNLAFGLTAGLPIVISQIVAIIILLFGHSINLFMSALGAFVHPMRLTFVEFYKNAGFESTLREFSPLKKISHNKN